MEWPVNRSLMDYSTYSVGGSLQVPSSGISLHITTDCQQLLGDWSVTSVFWVNRIKQERQKLQQVGNLRLEEVGYFITGHIWNR